jgi:hypothetical protein
MRRRPRPDELLLSEMQRLRQLKKQPLTRKADQLKR